MRPLNGTAAPNSPRQLVLMLDKALSEIAELGFLRLKLS
jgi:hypothetical protein